jgi:hypothetical protein
VGTRTVARLAVPAVVVNDLQNQRLRQQVHLDEVGQGRGSSLVGEPLAHARRDNLVEGDFAEEACLPALRVRAASVAVARDQGHEGRQELDGRSGQEQEHQQAWAQRVVGSSPQL